MCVCAVFRVVSSLNFFVDVLYLLAQAIMFAINTLVPIGFEFYNWNSFEGKRRFNNNCMFIGLNCQTRNKKKKKKRFDLWFNAVVSIKWDWLFSFETPAKRELHKHANEPHAITQTIFHVGWNDVNRVHFNCTPFQMQPSQYISSAQPVDKELSTVPQRVNARKIQTIMSHKYLSIRFETIVNRFHADYNTLLYVH